MCIRDSIRVERLIGRNTHDVLNDVLDGLPDANQQVSRRLFQSTGTPFDIYFGVLLGLFQSCLGRCFSILQQGRGLRLCLGKKLLRGGRAFLDRLLIDTCLLYTSRCV